jgi:hypothetical protein
VEQSGDARPRGGGLAFGRRRKKGSWAVAGPKGGTGPNGLVTWADSRENGHGLAREIGLKVIWTTDKNMNCFSN